MIKVYHLERSRSIRIPWLLQELEADYEMVYFSRDAVTNLAPPQLKQLHPLGKSPIIEHDGKILAESGVIMDYLIDVFDTNQEFRPAYKSTEYYKYHYWMHAAEGSFMNFLVTSMLFRNLGAQISATGDTDSQKEALKETISPTQKNYLSPSIAELIAFTESTLTTDPWFAGNKFSAADIQMGFVMQSMAGAKILDPNTHKHAFKWLEKIQARPAFQQALSKNNPPN